MSGTFYRGQNLQSLLNQMARSFVLPLIGDTDPVDGTSGTGAKYAGPGSYYINITNKNEFVNIGTLLSPTWQCVTEFTSQSTPVTIATTGNTDTYVVAPAVGILASMDIISGGAGALATSDTNYVTFTATNLGQAGAGSAVMLVAGIPNTTQATGGSAIVAGGRRALTLNATAANLVVARGDVIRVRMAVTGTLGGTVAGIFAFARFRNN